MSIKRIFSALVCAVMLAGFTACEKEELSSVADGPKEAVDLGLSVLWATCNVGAKSPEDYGDYFAWGETTPKENDEYKWGEIKIGDETNYGMTKYPKDPDNDGGNLTVLEPEDDAAYMNWGGDWRMPTYVELDELKTKCTWTWTSKNGTNGYEVKGTNGNSIFLPASGYHNGSSLGNEGAIGYYWSSSLCTPYPYQHPYPYYAYALNFRSDYYNCYYDSRFSVFSVRAVCEK